MDKVSYRVEQGYLHEEWEASSTVREATSPERFLAAQVAELTATIGRLRSDLEYAQEVYRRTMEPYRIGQVFTTLPAGHKLLLEIVRVMHEYPDVVVEVRLPPSAGEKP